MLAASAISAAFAAAISASRKLCGRARQLLVGACAARPHKILEPLDVQLSDAHVGQVVRPHSRHTTECQTLQLWVLKPPCETTDRPNFGLTGPPVRHERREASCVPRLVVDEESAGVE